MEVPFETLFQAVRRLKMRSVLIISFMLCSLYAQRPAVVEALKRPVLGLRQGALEVQVFEFRPFGGNDQGVTAFRDIVHFGDVGDLGEDGFGLLHGLGIMDTELGALALKTLAQIDRG